MADPPLVNQVTDTDPDHLEACGECCLSSALRWCGYSFTPDQIITWIRNNPQYGEVGVEHGTDVSTLKAFCDAHNVPSTIRTATPVGTGFTQATQRAHVALGAVWWDGRGSLGGTFGHWILSCPSGAEMNPWGGIYEHWTSLDLNAHGQATLLEIDLPEGAASETPMTNTEIRGVARSQYRECFSRIPHEVDLEAWTNVGISKGVDAMIAAMQSTPEAMARMAKRAAAGE